MLINSSSLDVIDNTGVKKVYLVVDSGKVVKVGDVSSCVISRVRSSSSKFFKGQLAKVLILGVCSGHTLHDRTQVKTSGFNIGVLVDSKVQPIGSRISIPFVRQPIRRKGLTKLLSVSPYSILIYSLWHHRNENIFFLYTKLNKTCKMFRQKPLNVNGLGYLITVKQDFQKLPLLSWIVFHRG